MHPELNKDEIAWLFQAMRDLCEPVVCLDAVGEIRFMNPSARDLLAFPADHADAVITDVLSLRSGGGTTGMLSAARKVIESGEITDIPAGTELLLENGEAVPVEGNIMPLRDEQGKIRGAVIRLHDHRGRVKSEKALRDSEMRFRQLSEASFEGVMIHDQGRIVDCNTALSRLTGYTHEELLGMDGFLLVTPESRPVIRGKIASGDEHPYEVVAMRKDGGTFPIEICGRTVPYDGRMLRVVVIRDITRLKRREEERLSAAEYLRVTLEREVHHRLKNTLQGVANLLFRHARQHPEITRYIDEAVTQIRSVSVALGLESLGHVQGVRLCELVTALKQSNESLTQQPIDLNIPPHVACPVHLAREESVALALVINELIMNAIKHSPANGQAAIEISSYPEGKGAMVRVCNTCDASNDEFDFTEGTGLSLVKSLLPLSGARLTYTRKGDRLCAELCLDEPVTKRAV